MGKILTIHQKAIFCQRLGVSRENYFHRVSFDMASHFFGLWLKKLFRVLFLPNGSLWKWSMGCRFFGPWKGPTSPMCPAVTVTMMQLQACWSLKIWMYQQQHLLILRGKIQPVLRNKAWQNLHEWSNSARTIIAEAHGRMNEPLTWHDDKSRDRSRVGKHLHRQQNSRSTAYF